MQLNEPRQGLERVGDAQLRTAHGREPDVGRGEQHVHVEPGLPFNERCAEAGRRPWKLYTQVPGPGPLILLPHVSGIDNLEFENVHGVHTAMVS